MIRRLLAPLISILCFAFASAALGSGASPTLGKDLIFLMPWKTGSSVVTDLATAPASEPNTETATEPSPEPALTPTPDPTPEALAAVVKAPTALLEQVERLTKLLQGGYASGREASIRLVDLGEGEDLALVALSVGGSGGGNNFNEFIAVFTAEVDEAGAKQYSLMDFLHVGGKGWRSIPKLNTKVSRNIKSQKTLIAIKALEVAGDDAPNFPTKPVTIRLSLSEDGRLLELKRP